VFKILHVILLSPFYHLFLKLGEIDLGREGKEGEKEGKEKRI